MTSEQPATSLDQTAGQEANELITINFAYCPDCAVQVILFPRTIQTFCYRCGQPVTNLDSQGLYYNPANLASAEQPQA